MTTPRYSVIISGSAERMLRKIRRRGNELDEKFLDEIDKVVIGLEMGRFKDFDIKPVKGEKDMYRVRIGSRRVLYKVDKKKHIISTLKIGKREGFYD